MSERFHFECVNISRGQFRLHDRREFDVATMDGEAAIRHERKCTLKLVSRKQNNRQIRPMGSFINDEYLTFSIGLDEVQGLMSGLFQLILAEHVIRHFETFGPASRSFTDSPIYFWGRDRNAVLINNDWTYRRSAVWRPEKSETNEGAIVFHLPDRFEVHELDYNSYAHKLMVRQNFDQTIIETELRAFRASQNNRWRLYVIFLAILSAGSRVRDFPDQLLTASGDGIHFGNDNKYLVYNRYNQEQEPPSSDSCSCNLVVLGVGFVAIIALVVVMQGSMSRK